METATKSPMKRVSLIDGSHITAGEKRAALALVNENKPEYLGRWMKANRIKLMVEPMENNQYKVSVKHHHALGLLGAYDTTSEFIVKLS